MIDAPIFTTGGFAIFSSSEKAALFRRIANENGLIILTDSDPAGFVIRNKLKGMLPKDKVIHLYAPALSGKEKRKKTPSKAGILGIDDFPPKRFGIYSKRAALLLTTILTPNRAPHAACIPKPTCMRPDFAAKTTAQQSVTHSQGQRAALRYDLRSAVGGSELLGLTLPETEIT